VSGSYDCTVRIWDIITGEAKHELKGHTQKGSCWGILYTFEQKLTGYIIFPSCLHSLQRCSRFRSQPSMFRIDGRLSSSMEPPNRRMPARPHRAYLTRWSARAVTLIPRISRRGLDTSDLGSRHWRVTAHPRRAHGCDNVLPARRVQSSQRIRWEPQDVERSRWDGGARSPDGDHGGVAGGV